MDHDEFRTQAQARGLSDPRTVRYEANHDPDLHTHDQLAVLMVVEGTIDLAFEDHTMTLGPGELCEVPAGTLHAERTGAGGATALLATG